MAAGKDEAHLGPGGTIFTKQGEEERRGEGVTGMLSHGASENQAERKNPSHRSECRKHQTGLSIFIFLLFKNLVLIRYIMITTPIPPHRCDLETGSATPAAPRG